MPKELIDQHIEEDEITMFNDARKLLSKVQLAELGAGIDWRKGEVIKQVL